MKTWALIALLFFSPGDVTRLSAQVALPRDTTGRVLFAYDFAAGRTGRFQLADTESDRSSFKYAFGGYAIIAKGPFSGASRLPIGRSLPNPATLEATGLIRAGADSGASWGIVFGADSASTSYFGFTVNALGEYAVFRRVPESGPVQFVSPVPHPAIRKGVGVSNTLGVRIDGSRLTLLANEYVLQTLDVGTVPVGQVMLMRAGPDPEGKMVVVFLSVRAVSGGA